MDKIFVAIASAEGPPLRGVVSINKMRRPEGSVLYWQYGTRGDASRQGLIERFLEEKEFEWILFLDADQVVPVDALERLLEHDVDVVSALYFRRSIPVMPVAFQQSDQWPLLPLLEYPKDSLFTIGATGFGFLLVRRRVLEDMKQKILKPDEDFVCNGPFPERTGAWQSVGADIRFCQRCWMLGYPVHMDSSVKVGHISLMVLSEPQYERQGGDFPLRKFYAETHNERKERGYSVTTREMLELKRKEHQRELQALMVEFKKLDDQIGALRERQGQLHAAKLRREGALLQIGQLLEEAVDEVDLPPVEPLSLSGVPFEPRGGEPSPADGVAGSGVEGYANPLAMKPPDFTIP